MDGWMEGEYGVREGWCGVGDAEQVGDNTVGRREMVGEAQSGIRADDSLIRREMKIDSPFAGGRK